MILLIGCASRTLAKALRQSTEMVFEGVQEVEHAPAIQLTQMGPLDHRQLLLIAALPNLDETEGRLELRLAGSGFHNVRVMWLSPSAFGMTRANAVHYDVCLKSLYAGDTNQSTVAPLPLTAGVDLRASIFLSTVLHDLIKNPLLNQKLHLESYALLSPEHSAKIERGLQLLESLAQHPNGTEIKAWALALREKITAAQASFLNGDKTEAVKVLVQAYSHTRSYLESCANQRKMLRQTSILG